MPEPIHVKIASDPFETWLAERPRWLQTAAAQMIENRRLPDEDEMAELVLLCKAEAAGKKDALFATVPVGSLAAAPGNPPIHIRQLLEVSGVNALKEGTGIDFGTANITVIYGQNGSGKTGFARLLKHACGSRAKEDILPNIFVAGNIPPTAKISIAKSGEIQPLIEWTIDAPTHRFLRDVHVFDSKSAQLYMGPKNEARYEPRKMRFLSSLIVVCDNVTKMLDAEKLALVKKTPALPPDFATTAGAIWVNGLTATTTAADVEKRCAYEQGHDDERIAGEQALNEKDIPGKLAQVTKSISTLQTLKTNLDALKLSFSNEQISPLVVARREALSKRKTASEDAKRVFAQAPLKGVGQDSWLALWKQARKYSESLAYPEHAFPVTQEQGRCVLCQQELDEQAQLRLDSFEAFVKNGLEAEAVAAEKILKDASATIPTMPTQEAWKLQCGVLKLGDDVGDATFLNLQTRWDGINTATDLAVIEEFDWSPFEELVTSLVLGHTTEQQTLTKLLQDENRKLLATRILDLRTSQWLAQNRKSIDAEIARLAALKRIEKAGALAKTNALTNKKNELGENELSTEYQARFAAELKELGGTRIPITPESKKEGKGKISFGLTIMDSKKPSSAARVLSEGETRIVTLAAFLADMGGSSDPSPFIFDDPISSLDQSFEERVVSRLVDLSKTRQVVVFTHRLSLLTLIENMIDRLKQQAKMEGKEAPATLQIQSLRRMGKVAGITNSLISIRDTNPQSAANRLRDEAVPQLAKLHAAGQAEEYEERAKSICSDFRILVERCVEKVLINDVLTRFRRSVETKNKIGALAKITPEDCQLVDNLMTRYSSFEHSQPDELPAELPDFEDIKRDVTALAAWIDGFKKRLI
ncbi:AAA family ATPase [Duganella aceris]|nr:AAA family ATPase [Duganella aceris]